MDIYHNFLNFILNTGFSRALGRGGNTNEALHVVIYFVFV